MDGCIIILVIKKMTKKEFKIIEYWQQKVKDAFTEGFSCGNDRYNYSSWEHCWSKSMAKRDRDEYLKENGIKINRCVDDLITDGGEVNVLKGRRINLKWL